MNNSIKMSVVSATLGALLAGAIFVSMAQTTVGTPTRIQYIPHPRDMVQIQQGTPYIVPTGKLFVLTALGDRGICGNSSSLSVNGQPEVYSFYANGNSMSAAAPGFTVAAGSTISLGGGCSNDPTGGRAWGYLVSQ